MTDEEYRGVQDSVALVASVVEQLPLRDFIDRAEKSLEVGAFADPAMYAKVAQRLELIVATARLLHGVQLLNAIAREDGALG